MLLIPRLEGCGFGSIRLGEEIMLSRVADQHRKLIQTLYDSRKFSEKGLKLSYGVFIQRVATA